VYRPVVALYGRRREREPAAQARPGPPEWGHEHHEQEWDYEASSAAAFWRGPASA
jgi:hypothetical protein